MAARCTLDKDINKCPHYRLNDETCHSETPCSFAEYGEGHSSKSGQYIREERWYEKYYRR